MKKAMAMTALLAIWVLFFYMMKWRGGYGFTFLTWGFGAVVVTSMLAIVSSTGLKIKVWVSRRSYLSGDGAVVTLRVTRSFPLLPLPWVVVRSEWSRISSGKTEYEHAKLLFPWFRSQVELQYMLTDLRRGMFRLEKAEAVFGDPFGFINSRRTFTEDKPELVVYPRPAAIPLWDLGKTDSSSINRSLTERAEWSGSVREYVPGDSLRSVHWLSSARSQSLKTREPASVRDGNTYVILDAGTNLRQQSFERMVRAAAGLSLNLSRTGTFAGLAICGHTCIRSGDSSIADVMNLLARAEADGGSRLNERVRSVAISLPKGTELVLITEKITEEIVQLCEDIKLSRRKVRVVAAGAGNKDGMQANDSEAGENASASQKPREPVPGAEQRWCRQRLAAIHCPVAELPERLSDVTSGLALFRAGAGVDDHSLIPRYPGRAKLKTRAPAPFLTERRGADVPL
ncbi:DUF58 domain-containing protein [Paenibacillus turpanensis]|uniref:DUF58 domain-containing protein n=1 Tax=Paenibacillus turpanensis TaxID=2689078 RepID=UPI00140C6840|nr:DUF58 domain-containing protein [Paenibacillus turpanensis]